MKDTRAWRLEEYKDKSPLVAALLEWRKAERIATTYGYALAGRGTSVRTAGCAGPGPAATGRPGG